MTNEVRDSYDAVAPLYASLFLGDLEGDGNATEWLAKFANRASQGEGPVLDLGCGPGHVVNHLAGRGLHVIGYDLSPGQISEARNAFRQHEFEVGDLTSIDRVDSSVGGIVSRYSLIHFPPAVLVTVFREWMRLLEPGAPILVSFFGSTSAATHGTPFDHKVVTAYEMHPPTVADLIRDAGFTDIEVGTAPPPADGRPFDQATILAVKPT